MQKQSKWWQEIVIYQIYPRSFKDTNGDGIGDLQGIIDKLPYLETLGIGAIWLSPVYKSPNDDNGYDISDYLDIMDEFGTMSQMEELIDKANQAGIKIIMDLVVNHSSDEHPWFIEAKKGKDNPYRDYYIWADPKPDGSYPTDLKSAFSGPAWTYEPTSGQYYLHQFSKKQPDLNWQNPKLRQAVYDMMNAWIKKGIGGFRLDVIDLIGKDPMAGITVNGPDLHPFLHEMNRASFGNYDLLTVGETWSADPPAAILYSDPDRQELSMVFQFEHILLDQDPEGEKWDLRDLSLADLKRVFAKWQTALGDKGWNSLFWNNHDLPRIVSRWGNDGQYRVQSAKMLAILLHMMKGTPYIYQGEEIGMVNTPIKSIQEADDIESINYYHEQIEKGKKSVDLLHQINVKGRDNARRPIPWTEEDNGGFTSGQPWLALNPNYRDINVAQALEDPSSVFYTYQTLIALRKEHPIMVWGDFELLETQDEIFAYYRTYQDKKWLVICNFSNDGQVFSSQDQAQKVIIANFEADLEHLQALKLGPWDAVVYEVQ